MSSRTSHADKLAGMSVKELRQFAADSGVDLRQCVEKRDMVEALCTKASRPQASASSQVGKSVQHNDWAAEAAGISGGRMPCSVCGRRFAMDR